MPIQIANRQFTFMVTGACRGDHELDVSSNAELYERAMLRAAAALAGIVEPRGEIKLVDDDGNVVRTITADELARVLPNDEWK